MGQEKHKAHDKLAFSSGISGMQKVAATVGARQFFFVGAKLEVYARSSVFKFLLHKKS